MHKSKIVQALSLISVIAVCAVGSAGVAQASPSEETPVERANPGLSEEILESLPEVVKNSDVRIDSSYEAGMPIVYPDGTPVPGQPERKAAAALSCGGTVYGSLATWGPVSTGSCGVFGHPGYERYYHWVKTGSLANGCVQGKGFNSSATQTWYSLSCGIQNLGQAVPWGNVLASPATRAASTNPPVVFTANWG